MVPFAVVDEGDAAVSEFDGELYRVLAIDYEALVVSGWSQQLTTHGYQDVL